VFETKQTNGWQIKRTGTKGIGDLLTDLKGVVLKFNTSQEREALGILRSVIKKYPILYQSDVGSSLCSNSYQLSFTGHSLGAWLAELSVW